MIHNITALTLECDDHYRRTPVQFPLSYQQSHSEGLMGVNFFIKMRAQMGSAAVRRGGAIGEAPEGEILFPCHVGNISVTNISNNFLASSLNPIRYVFVCLVSH